ncbi:MAG TPA: Imm52 family immunity protein, partial [Archangium sp.]|nr:Imm52 family immunity protein [Archangium sp.]
MQDKYYAGAYWGPRKETALECARRAELFFHMLARCDSSFVQWYGAGRGSPRDLPGWPIRPELEELEDFFLKGRHRGASKTVLEDMGFSRIVWNAKKEATEVHLSCGKYSPWGGPNLCLLKP